VLRTFTEYRLSCGERERRYLSPPDRDLRWPCVSYVVGTFLPTGARHGPVEGTSESEQVASRRVGPRLVRKIVWIRDGGSPAPAGTRHAFRPNAEVIARRDPPRFVLAFCHLVSSASPVNSTPSIRRRSDLDESERSSAIFSARRKSRVSLRHSQHSKNATRLPLLLE